MVREFPGGLARARLPPRYVQFAFRRDGFYLELTKYTLFPNEAEIILQRRQGFYWAKNRQDLRWVSGTGRTS